MSYNTFNPELEKELEKKRKQRRKCDTVGERDASCCEDLCDCPDGVACPPLPVPGEVILPCKERARLVTQLEKAKTSGLQADRDLAQSMMEGQRDVWDPICGRQPAAAAPNSRRRKSRSKRTRRTRRTGKANRSQ